MKTSQTQTDNRPNDCECDNTHEQNKTCCRPCWEAGFRTVVQTDKVHESKATARPWQCAPAGAQMEKYSQSFAIIEKGKPNLIAGLFADVNGGEETAKANAALIVRAVNSYEPLVAALNLCENVIGMAVLQGKLSDNALSPQWDALRAARKCLDAAREGKAKS